MDIKLTRSFFFAALFLAFGFGTSYADSLDQSPLAGDDKLRAMRITSIFENGTPEFDYAYIENLHDGRGFTAGRVGFCSGTGDMLAVVERYTELEPGNALAPYLDRLRQLNALHLRGKPSDSEVGLSGLAKAWAKAGKDSKFIQAQDDTVDQMYFDPAIKYANEFGIHSAIGKAILYDSMIMHGDEAKYSDSIRFLLRVTQEQYCKTKVRSGGVEPCESPENNFDIERMLKELQIKLGQPVQVQSDCVPKSPSEERAWLNIFLNVRKEDMKNPIDASTKDEWSQNAVRTDILRDFLNIYNGKIPPANTQLDNYYYKGKLGP